jgi:hypothetical protein
LVHRHRPYRPSVRRKRSAINEVLDGKAVDWMEKVSDEQYNQR